MFLTARRRLLALAAVAFMTGCSADDPMVATSADPVRDAGMDMEDDAHDHDHDEVDAIAWDGEVAPVIEVTVSGGAETGWDIAATVSGFSFSDATAIDHVAGWGHTHVFLDGELVSMSYEPVVHVDDLDPGPHQATVTLSRNDHTDYSLDGELIASTTTFVVAGAVDPADTVIAIAYADGAVVGVDERIDVTLGDTVDITMTSDLDERLHVHGYDRFLEVGPGGPATIRFDALIPGAFEVELEGSGTLLFELEVS